MSSDLALGAKFERFVAIMAKLRAPGGCPWDREQTFDSIKPFLIEETYEVIDAIDRRDYDELRGELGDLLLQAVFFAQMADEEKRFNIGDSIDAISEKLIRRHPHVFADETAATEADVRKRWSEIKQQEKKDKGDSPQALLDSVPRALPALVEAQQLASRAAQVGFDWPNVDEVLAKLDEERAELAAAQTPEEIESEIGDLAFHRNECGTILQGGCGAGSAPFKREVPQTLRARGALAKRGGQTVGGDIARTDGGAMAGVETVASPVIEVRALTTPEEFRVAVELQQTIWGFDAVDLLPARLFVVAGKIGGHSFGAFHNGQMIAFCLSIPGLKPGGRYYLHSHMLGVAKAYRNQGVGRMLKLKQREDALERGIDLIEWTFDPLELKNAYFNIERLGAVVQRYVRNQYGQTSSQLHGGLPTDRCTAEWWLTSERVTCAIKGQPFARPAVEERIAIPADIDRLRNNDPRRAREIQEAASDRFVDLFARDYAVIAFEKSADAGVYCFGKLA